MCPNNSIPRNIRSSRILRSVGLQVVTDVSGQPIGLILKKFWTARPLKMGPKGCTETSVSNYQSKLRKLPEERGVSFTPRREAELTQRHSTSSKYVRNSGPHITGVQRHVLSTHCVLVFPGILHIKQ